MIFTSAVVLFFILFVFLAFRRLDWAVMFLLAALPGYRLKFHLAGIPTTFLELMILAVFFIWLLRNYRAIFLSLKNRLKKRNRETNQAGRYPFDWEMAALLLISFIAVFTAGLTMSALGVWKAYFFEPLLFFIVFFNVFMKKAAEEKSFLTATSLAVWPLAFSAIIFSFLAGYQYFTGSFLESDLCPTCAAAATRRAFAVFGYPNALGLYLGPLVLLFLGCAAALAAEKKWSKILKDYKIATLFAAAAFSIAAIVFAKSAGAFFAVAAGLVVFGLLAGKKPRLATVLLIIIAAAGIFSVPKAREAVLKEIILKDFSGQVRRQQWSETWAMLQDGRLFFGAGLANYQKAFAPYHAGGFYYNRDNDPEFMRKIVVWGPTYWKKVWQPVEIYMYPHNIFLNFWSELGLLGLLLFVLIIVKFFILGGKLITDHGSQITDRFFIAGLIGAMVVVVIHGLVDVPYFKNDLAVMFWLFLAMMGAAGIALKPDEKKNLK